jgi:hypothetical protein
MLRREYPMSILEDSAAIAYASGFVINKRLQLIAQGGPPAYAETFQMFAEKAELFTVSALSMASGGSLASVVKSYRRIAEANVRRLKQNQH